MVTIQRWFDLRFHVLWLLCSGDCRNKLFVYTHFLPAFQSGSSFSYRCVYLIWCELLPLIGYHPTVLKIWKCCDTFDTDLGLKVVGVLWVERCISFCSDWLRSIGLLLWLLLSCNLLIIRDVEIHILSFVSLTIYPSWFLSLKAILIRLYYTFRAHERRRIVSLICLSCSHDPLHDQRRSISTIACIFCLIRHCYCWLGYFIDDAFVSFLLSLFLFFFLFLFLKLSSQTLPLFRFLFRSLVYWMLIVQSIKFVYRTQYASMHFLQVTIRQFISAERLLTAANTIVVKLKITITLVFVLTLCMGLNWLLDCIVKLR